MMLVSGASKIFVSIATYRDPEAPRTVADLLAKADRPHNVRVGVLSQLASVDDHCIVGNTHQVREVIIPHTEGRGACWARHRIFTTLMHDEDFVLQIDGHSRFEKGWDTKLLRMFERTQDPLAVFSVYPGSYDPMTGMQTPLQYTRFDCQDFTEYGWPRVSAAAMDIKEAPLKAQLTFFIAAGCMFTRVNTVRKVPYDPYLYFIGEEVNYAIRLWTHGFNIYTPNEPFMYHYYGRSPMRKLHHDEHKDWTQYNNRSVARNRHLLGIETSHDPEVLQFIDRFSLGKVRSLAAWQRCSGIHLKTMTLTADTMQGIMQPYQTP